MRSADYDNATALTGSKWVLESTTAGVHKVLLDSQGTAVGVVSVQAKRA